MAFVAGGRALGPLAAGAAAAARRCPAGRAGRRRSAALRWLDLVPFGVAVASVAHVAARSGDEVVRVPLGARRRPRSRACRSSATAAARRRRCRAAAAHRADHRSAPRALAARATACDAGSTTCARTSPTWCCSPATSSPWRAPGTPGRARRALAPLRAPARPLLRDLRQPRSRVARARCATRWPRTASRCWSTRRPSSRRPSARCRSSAPTTSARGRREHIEELLARYPAPRRACSACCCCTIRVGFRHVPMGDVDLDALGPHARRTARAA